MLTAASPRRLNRATNLATVVLLPQPACRAAAANPCPWTTANTAVARRTRSTRSLLLRASRSNAACSAGVTARTGSFCGVAILDLLRDSAVSSIAPDSATYLRHDPLVYLVASDLGEAETGQDGARLVLDLKGILIAGTRSAPRRWPDD